MPLSVKDGMGAWVKDFQDSNAPQFKGKSDKERREMAIAAYMSAKRGNKNEATDKPPFDPDPPKPQAKNSDGSATSPMSRAKQLAKKARDAQKDEGYVSHAQRKAVWANRADGGKGHPDKKKNEAVEENNNAPQTAAHRRAMMVGVNRSNKVKLKGFGPDQAKGNMGNPSARAALKPKNEEYTNDDYLNGNKVVKVKSGNHAGKTGYVISRTNKDGKIHFTVDHDRTGYGNNSSTHPGNNLKVHKESVELDEMKANVAYTKAAKDIKAYAAKDGGIDKKDMMNFAADLELMGRAPNILQAGRILDRINKRFGGYDTDVRDRLSMYLKKHGLMESVSEAKLDELSPATHDRYQKAAHKSAVQGVAQMRMGTRSAKSMADNQRKRQAGIDTSKFLNRKQHGVKPNYEAKSFDQKFRDHLKFSTSKSPAVQAYLKKRAADRDAMNKKNDPNAAKKGYALSATPPERAYMKARKHGMSTGQARDALSQKAVQKKKMSGKLPG